AYKWLFRDRALEKVFCRLSGLFEVRRFQHDADAGAVIFKGNNPEPAIQRANHPGECGIDSSLTFQTFVVGKKREFLQMLITSFQLEFVSDDRIAPTGID